MMTLDHVGDQEAMVYAQLGQQPLVRTTATSLEPRQGSLSCLRAQPPDLADLTVARPKVACVPLAGLPFLYSKRAAAARSLVSRYGRLDVLWPLRLYHSSGELASPPRAPSASRLSTGPRACPPPVRSSPHVKL